MAHKHDSIITSLEQVLTNENKKVFRNVEYGTKTKTIGEIDLYYVDYFTLNIFEIKSNNTAIGRAKAFDQLTRARKLFSNYIDDYIRDTRLFYVYGNKSNNDYVINRIFL